MNPLSRFFLPVYFLMYALFLVVTRSWLVSRKIGKIPVVLSSEDNAHGLVGNYFKAIIGLVSLYIFVIAFFPDWYGYVLPFPYLQHKVLLALGILLLVVSFVIVFIAQINMQNSFRVGIDEAQKTDLINNGLFRYSRNPIYLGMMITLVGVFLVQPNVFTLFILIIGYVLIQIQIRLEEEYLAKMHGAVYTEYCRQVRRWI